MDHMHMLPRFTDLTLVLTERCNMRCSYCYVPKTGRTMSREVAMRAVDFLVERAPPGRRLSISFFGGEPFLERGLMEEVMAYARRRRPDQLGFTTPTNGTLIDQPAHDLAAGYGMQVALSVDSADPDELCRIAPHLQRLRRLAPILRMTVTPTNVDGLCESIVSLFQEGFSTIMHQPALERPWTTRAKEVWREQHRQLADWACHRYERRLPLPKLTVLEGIVSRLGGRKAGYCGAGVRMAAVDPEGKLFGCYRSLYDPRAAQLVLGDLHGGPVNETLLATYARLDPARARPGGQGSCRECKARDGCTVYCAAMGHVLLGDLRAVPVDACDLMRIQVSTCREVMERMARRDRADRRRRRSAGVAAAALALSLATGTAACGDRATTPSDAGSDAFAGLCPADFSAGLCPAEVGPGQCPPPPPDMGRDLIGPGLCPDMSTPDLRPPDVGADLIGPGLCPPPMDWGGPGLCPILPDAVGPGLCPVPIPDGMPGPGLCPVPMPDGMPGPGLCPVPVPDGMTVPKPDWGTPGPGLCPTPIPTPDGSPGK